MGNSINATSLYNPPTRLASPKWGRIPVHLLSSGAQFTAQVRYYSRARNDHPSVADSHRTDPDMEINDSNKISLSTASDPDLPHLNSSQHVHMTKIAEKPVTKRQATATCVVQFSNPRPWEILREGRGTKKGDVFSVARIAGIMAAKKTPDLVPLCHPGIGITGVEVDVRLLDPDAADARASDGSMGHGAMHVTATVSCLGRTGVEMEAMTATMGAALTVYDMLKAVDKGMVIGGVKLLEKKGGKSGHWVRHAVVKDNGGTE
ncbi:MoaC-domain-containing protein [Aspergillus japonicus CBS 114.51]|nr:MoaC-domain-containing protein [Aspergillus japonicus CBS 114.51]RAH79860.1 MoaC-domain-containing protein [Aspergillus japonicus CBS 114.51]